MKRTGTFVVLICAAVFGTPLSAPAQVALIEPMELDFGQVTVGTSVTLPLTVTSVSVDDLRIFAIMIAPADNPTGFFDITAMDSIDDPLELGESVSAQVSYAPTSLGAHAGVLTVVTNDTYTPVVEIDLLGESIVPEPATLALLALGSFGLAALRRRRK